MNATSPTPLVTSAAPRLHPLVAIAAVAVTAVSLAGLGVLTGVLPLAKTTNNATTVNASSPAIAPLVSAPAAPPAAPVVTPVATANIVPPAPTIEASPVEKPMAKPVAKLAARPTTKPAVKTAAEPSAEKVSMPVAENVPAPVISLPPAAVASPALPPCQNCGVIDNVREIAQPGDASGIGAVAGGVLGGVLGNQVGGGSGKKIATVLGAAGGAYAGHQMEKSRNKTTRYEIDVRMNDGSMRTLTQDTVPAWRVGDHVRVENDRLAADHLPSAPPVTPR